METIAAVANGFMALFKAGGETFTAFVTGIIPLIIVLMTAVNSLIKIIGEERFYHVAKKATKYTLTRYTVVPVLAIIFMGSPMCFTFGQFVEEKYKPAFYDAAVSFVHPVTGLFPHANGSELFVYMGIAAGVQALGYELRGTGCTLFSGRDRHHLSSRTYYGKNISLSEIPRRTTENTGGRACINQLLYAVAVADGEVP